MAFLRNTVTGNITLPDGSALPDGGKILFQLVLWDKDDDTVALPGIEIATVSGGSISVQLIRTGSTDRMVGYQVGYTYWNPDTRLPVKGWMGRIAIVGSGTKDLADLLNDAPLPDPSIPDALAQAVSAAAAALQSAQDANNAALMALVGTGTGFDSVQQMLDSDIGYGANSLTHNGETVTLNVAAGDIWTVKGVGAFKVLASGASAYDHITSPGGVKLDVVGQKLIPEMFLTIETAFTAAARLGRSLKGTPGATYTFTAGVTVSNAPMKIDMTGCTLLRGVGMANRSALRIKHDLSAATYATADSVVSYELASYNFSNGATYVPRIEVSSGAEYAAGDVVKVLSADKIPSIDPWPNQRYAEIMEVGAVVGNYLYLIRPFAETWTPAKIVKMQRLPVSIKGGEWSEAEGYPAARNTPMVELMGLVEPEVEGMTFRDTATTQLSVVSCFKGATRRNRYLRPRHSATYTAYAYGEKVSGGATQHTQWDAFGSSCRHVFDTGSLNITDAGLNSSDPMNFGGVTFPTVWNGIGMDSLNAPFADHPDSFGLTLINCRAMYSNRRADGSTLWGLELRGREATVIGGEYESLVPLRIEPSAKTTYRLKGTVLRKVAAVFGDAFLDPMLDLTGVGIVEEDARAKVIFDDVTLIAKRGYKELCTANRVSIEFDGRIEYAATGGNPVGFRLTDSDMTWGDTRVTFEDADALAVTSYLTIFDDAQCRVDAPGRVDVTLAGAPGESLVLTDFSNFDGIATWSDVRVNGQLYVDTGFRNAASASVKRFGALRTDTLSRMSDVTVFFSGGAGAKTLSWPAGNMAPEIVALVTPTATGTYPGGFQSGAFTGQRLTLVNVAASISFEVNDTPASILVAATRTVAPGASITLRWDGTVWVA